MSTPEGNFFFILDPSTTVKQVPKRVQCACPCGGARKCHTGTLVTAPALHAHMWDHPVPDRLSCLLAAEY